jgi:hypothetical protein
MISSYKDGIAKYKQMRKIDSLWGEYKQENPDKIAQILNKQPSILTP